MNNLKNRILFPLLKRAMAAMPVVVVTGARQTGKTTLVRDLFAQPGRKYYSLDYPEIAEQFRTAPETLLREGALIIDEVQREPGVLLALKRWIDSGHRTPGSALLTGSANLALMDSVGETLAGRAYYLELRPFCPMEWVGQDNLSVLDGLFSEKFDATQWPAQQGDWMAWAIAGGYPGA